MSRSTLATLVVCVIYGLSCTSAPVQNQPPDTPTLEQPTAPSEGQSDLFFGTLNGFTFGTEEVPPLAAMSTKCTFSPGAGSNLKDVGAAAAAASELHFKLTYVPATMQPDYVAASQCEDEVFLINAQYSGQSVGFVQVLRRKGPPEFRAETDRAGLVPTTIGGRPSVIAGDFLIYMRDDISAWRLVGVGPGPHELQKIAEGLSTD